MSGKTAISRRCAAYVSASFLIVGTLSAHENRTATLDNSRRVDANVYRPVDGAVDAARVSRPAGAVAPTLAILISCVGRKLVLTQRVEEEVEGVRAILGEQAVVTGFYSYGEIAPFSPGGRSGLHNRR